MKKILSYQILIILILIFQSVHARNITVKSLHFSDVKKSIDIAQPGDKIYLPEGVGKWGYGQGLKISGGISIIGKGMNKTVIKRVQASNLPLITFNGLNSEPNEMKGIALEGGYFYKDKEYNRLSRGVEFINGGLNFKVSECRFKGFANYAISVNYKRVNRNLQKGVIYKNEFIDNYYSQVQNYGYGVVIFGNGSWGYLELGTENAIYIEDNFFSGNRHHVASNNGSRYVFRYNKVKHTNKVRNFSMVDAHGKSSTPIGSRSYEIYDNEFYTSDTMDSKARTAIGIRGGDGVIFNNSSTSSIYRTVELSTEGFSCGTYPGVNQIRSLYIWNNEANDQLKSTVNGIANNCETSIKKGRDYYLSKRPGYEPYIYPHPLRNINEKIPEPVDEEEEEEEEVNIALHKPTTASGVYQNGTSDKAVDGNDQSTNWWSCLFFNNWWQVDLQKEYNLDEINIVNYYGDGRYYNYVIETSTNGKNWQQVAMKTDKNMSTKEGRTFNLERKNIKARYIKVRTYFNSVNKAVHIVEFRAYGSIPSSQKSGAKGILKNRIDQGSVTSQNLKMFPNPVTSGQVLTLALPNAESYMGGIMNIYSLTGQLLLKKEFFPDQQNHIYFDTTSLHTGTYIIKAVINDKTFMEKLIVK